MKARKTVKVEAMLRMGNTFLAKSADEQREALQIEEAAY